MRICQLRVVLVVSLLLCLSLCEAKKRKHHRNYDESSESSKTKTKTKWSSSSNLAAQTKNAMVASEEHGYYVKRTFLPLDAEGKNITGQKSPPFLGIPIAWFPCQDTNCLKFNSLAINAYENAIKGGFLCDDDCSGPYEPICGRTSSELAVFYNKCKLNVAKCRSHGYWSDLAFDDCKTQYPEEVKYAELKFHRNPYFRKPAAGISAKEENKLLLGIASTENNDEELTTTSEQLLIQELTDAKPLEKMAESIDLYKDINSARSIIKKIQL